MHHIGKWMVKYGLNLKKIGRLDNNRGQPGEYLIDLPNGSNAITVTKLMRKHRKSAVYRTVVNGGYNTLRGEGVQYVKRSTREIAELLDGMKFLKRISL